MSGLLALLLLMMGDVGSTVLGTLFGRHASDMIRPQAALAGQSVSPAGKPAREEESVAAFYRGRTVRLVVGFAPGGGYDTYSRLIARHFGAYIPGHPTVIVESMPGAGSMRAANYVYNAAPRDGTVIGNISGQIMLEQVFGAPGVQFDLGRMRHLAVPVSDAYLLIVTKKTGVRRVEDILGPMGKRVVLGVISGTTAHAGLLLRDVLGANIKVVSGYDGTSKIRLAIENGEVDGMFLTWASAKISSLDKFTTGEWVILAQLTDDPLPDLPISSVPAIQALGTNDEQRQLLRFGIGVPSQFSKMYVLAPDVPPDRAAALESAFARTLADEELLAAAAKAKLEIAPIPARQVHKRVVEYLGMSPDIRSSLEKVLKPARH